MNKLFVLVEIHIKEKIRRPFHTFWELASGVLVFVLLLLIKQVLVQESKDYEKYIETLFSAVDIVYTPSNSLSESLMSRICQDNFMGDPNNTNKVRCFGLSDGETIETFLHRYNQSMAHNVVFIKFKNLNENKLPAKLEYELQLKYLDMPLTKIEDLYRIYQNDVNLSKNVTFFANLQWYIDKRFLEQISGHNISHTIQLFDITEHISPEMRVIHSFLIICTILGPLPFFMYSSSRLVIEKSSGLKELLKLVGVSRYNLRMSHFIDTAIFAIIYSIIVTILLKVTFTPILVKSNPVIICVSLWLHFLTMNTLAFITSTLSHNAQHADSVALLVYLFTFLVNTLWYHRDIESRFALLLLYITLPHAPIFVFWDEVTSLEDLGEGATFSNLFNNHQYTESDPVALVWFYLLIRLIMLLNTAAYLDMVRPGRYGIAAKWNFFFKKKYWAKKKKCVNFHVTSEKKMRHMKDDRYFEKPPRRTKVAIKVAHVSKVFKNFHEHSVKALDCVSLDVYKGEIAIILGPNGAGKTTLLSLMTGMYSATGGTVYINGLDNSARLQDVCKDIAYCPQINMTFDHLTVKEHLVFFEKLRGFTPDKSTDIETIMILLKLKEKADYYSTQLSSGVRKCLQVACVLVGDSEVLVLDEPTSGMDAQMRHSVWDLLLTLRKEKTIVMTTRLMQEADALGDRIAVLNHGKLKCHGSPKFLKNAIGADFKLSIRFDHRKDLGDISKDLETKLEAVDVKLSSMCLIEHRISLDLPAVQREQFPKVFDILEANRHELGITAMDVGISMEQVFLRFIEDSDDVFADSVKLNPDLEHEECLKGWPLVRQQLRSLILRAYFFVWSHKYQFIILQVLLPSLALIVVTIATNSGTGYSKVFDMHPVNRRMVVLYNPIGSRKSNVLEPLAKRYPEVKFLSTDDLDGEIISELRSQKDIEIYGYKVALNGTDIFYYTPSTQYFKAVNIFSNIYMSLHMPYAVQSLINTSYEALDARMELVQPKNIYMCAVWSTWVVFLSVLPMAPMVLLCIEEYHKGVRFRHLLAGCSSSVLCLAKLVAHVSIYLVTVPPTIIVVAALLDTDKTINRPNYLFAVFVLFIIFGPAFYLRWYACSYLLNKKYPTTRIYITCLVFGAIGPIFLTLMNFTGLSDFTEVVLAVMMNIIMIFIPEFVMSVGLFDITAAARNNAYCRLNFHMCPYQLPSDPWVNKAECCNSESGEPYGYFKAKSILFLLLHWIFYWTLVVLLQHRTLQMLKEYIVSYRYKIPPKVYKTKRVKIEEDYVHVTMETFNDMTLQEKQNDPDVLLVADLHKAFTIGRCKIKPVVKGVSFSVRRGECLGLIGRNSSGKTSTLRMVSGYRVMTKGATYINGYYINLDRRKYLRNVVWAIESGFDDFLSGYKNLQLLALLYGHNANSSQRLASQYLNFMGLARNMHSSFKSFSPGCAQRLSVCTALIGAPVVALLDEPCANVDPYTRPLVTRAVRRLLDSGTACVIGEESMEWKQVDRICTRLAIMDRGEIIAIGSVKEIREEIASGYTVILKIKIDAAFVVVDDDSGKDDASLGSNKAYVPVDDIPRLKREFLELFPYSILTDEHMTMLFFHIRDPYHKMCYSELFTKLEDLSNRFEIVEDYTLSETSVDEVLCRVEQELHQQSRTKQKSITMNLF